MKSLGAGRTRPHRSKPTDDLRQRVTDLEARVQRLEAADRSDRSATILHNTEKIMADIKEVRDELARVKKIVQDDNTSDAAVVVALKDQNTALQAEIDRLTALGVGTEVLEEIKTGLTEIANTVSSAA